MELPATGLAVADVRDALRRAGADDVDWRRGRGWSLVYDSPSWHSALVEEAAQMFAHENALSHSAFPSAARFEAGVIAMVRSVVAPGAPCCGVFTAGGSESILMALKAHRDAPRARGHEVVVPRTGHPAFWKAAQLLGLSTRLVQVDASGVVDPDDVAAAIGRDTLMVGLSAPNFPYGTVDPVADIAPLAAEHGVGLHVDASLGGLFLPFLPDLPAQPMRFGTDVGGVTSVSVDVHKYGYAAKGASVLLFAAEELRHAAYFVSTRWPGGAYAASSVLGTRSVGPAAAAYASMLALGENGYRRLVGDVMASTRRLQRGLQEHAFQVVGDPAMAVFAAQPDDVPLAGVAAGLARRGWWVDTQAEPPSLHFVVFPRHDAVVDAFLADLTAVLEDPPRTALAQGQRSYGVMIKGEDLDEEALFAHLDARYDDPA